MQKKDCKNRRELVSSLQTKLQKLETKRLAIEAKQLAGDRSIETIREMASVVLSIEFTRKCIGDDCEDADLTGWMPSFNQNPQKICRL